MRTLLLEIVSRQTGYPLEMLGLDLSLEADLGIDSIKRTEIIAELVSHLSRSNADFPHGLDVPFDIRCLRDILNHFGADSAPNADARNETPSPPPDSEPVERFRMACVDTPVDATVAFIPQPGTLLILDSGGELGACMARELVHRGQPVQRLTVGNGTQKADADLLSVDLQTPESADRVVSEIQRRHGSVAGLLYLLPWCRKRNGDTADAPLPDLAPPEDVRPLFYLIRALGTDFAAVPQNRKRWLVAVTAMGGGLTGQRPPGPDGQSPNQGAVAGMLKALALEWPRVDVRVVDLEPHPPAETLAGHLMTELAGPREPVQTGWDGTRRVCLTPSAVPLPGIRKTRITLDADSVVLLTGGARGITADVALEMARRHRPVLVLAGRSPRPPLKESEETARLSEPNEIKAALIEKTKRSKTPVVLSDIERQYRRLLRAREIRRNLSAMQESGCRVHYFPVDVTDTAGLENLIDTLYADFGRLDGVIHGAGVIADKRLVDKDPERFDQVFDTKVTSALTLSRKLRFASLKFLVFFASVAGIFGNRGQGDYAAANEALNKLALWLDARWTDTRIVSVNWGPWADTGMVTPELERAFAQRGIGLIPRPVGVRKFMEELFHGPKGDSEILLAAARQWTQPLSPAFRAPHDEPNRPSGRPDAPQPMQRNEAITR